jgi:hypothetical protein
MTKKFYDVQYKPDGESLEPQGYKMGKKLRNSMVVWFKEINSAPAGTGLLNLNGLADALPMAQELIRTGRIQVGYDGDVDDLIKGMGNMGMGGGKARRRKSRKSRRSKKTRKSRKSRRSRK